MPPATCPHCGADVPRNAQSCPGCGAVVKSGWCDEAHASGLGLPEEDDFDYENFVKSEFGGGPRSPKPHGISWLWWLTALILVILLLFLFLR